MHLSVRFLADRVPLLLTQNGAVLLDLAVDLGDFLS